MAATTVFPPPGPTTLTQVILSYLYQQYSDDDDLQAFVAAYNAQTQAYIDTFNDLNLPVYTGPNIIGPLLDWVLTGIYGFARPVLPSGHSQNVGAYNSFVYNKYVYNTHKIVGPSVYFATSDDVYKRCATWLFYKGDGKVFDVRWLKRRIMRFLIGVNGTAPNVDQTYQISVTFSGSSQVNINILGGLRMVTGGALYNRTPYNKVVYNKLESTFVSFSPFPLAPIFKAAVEAGALEMPFQFSYVISV